jgi:hypothetical protein
MIMTDAQRTRARTVVMNVLRACGRVGAYEEVFLPAIRSLEPRAEVQDVRRELERFERGCVAFSNVDDTGRRYWKMVSHYPTERH